MRRAPGPFVPLYLAILLVAASLRMWRLSWGLDDGLFFPDELYWGVRGQALANLSSHWLVPGDLVYPTLYGYLTGLAALLGSALSLVDPVPAEGVAFDVILAARGLSVAAGTATVALVAVLGSRLYSTRVGVAAAALLAVAPLHAMQVHYASVDVLLSMGFALTALAAYGLAKNRTLGRAALAGASAGLTFATKYVGLAALATVAVVIARVAVSERSWTRVFLLSLAAFVGFAMVFLVTCPPCVMHPNLLVSALQFNYNNAAQATYPNNCLTQTLGWYGHPYLYQVVASLPFSLGWPAACLAFIGIGVAGWRRTSGDLVLLAVIAPYFLVMGASDVTFPRYLLPIFPALVVLASRAVFAFQGAPWIRGAVLASVLVYSTALTLSQTGRFSYDQQHEIAGWIATRAPIAGEGTCTRVAVPRTLNRYYRLREPLGRVGLAYLTARDGHWFEGEPEVFVLPEWYEIAIVRDGHSEAATRDLERLKSGTAGYRKAGRWKSSYLQQSFYSWLDPAFAVDLWQGEIGFTVYLRERPWQPGENPVCDEP